MVDNNPISFLHQPANGVPCQPFRCDGHGHGAQDRHLSAVLLPLLQSLALFPDVRPILEARFHLAAWFVTRLALTPGPPAADQQGHPRKAVAAAVAGGRRAGEGAVAAAGQRAREQHTEAREAGGEGCVSEGGSACSGSGAAGAGGACASSAWQQPVAGSHVGLRHRHPTASGSGAA